MNIIENIKIVQAKTFWQRFYGFMLKKDADYALLFQNCSSVHTFFMRFNIDVLFIDKNDKVIKVKNNVKPWRIVMPVKNAVSIIEIPSSLNKTKIF
ncbi:MAG: DUF192 domain-containing protein [Endomicrobia bacterium]|nr:DUF192 domain-containing protein [Endomicrobiia bacterium]MCL2507447.1 DUF192 domain-containing protein [Endomicrobiia bacterium]